MQSKRNFRVALLLALSSADLACMGQIEAPGGDAPISSGGASGRSGSVASGGSMRAGGTTASNAGANGALPELPLWTGFVGSWCGPGDNPTVWLVAKPSSGTCDASSKKVFAEQTADESEGWVLQLDPTQLGVFPAALTLPARYCSATAGSCAEVQVAITVESFTQGQGAKGTWSFSPPGQTQLAGRLEASWCAYDDLLPPHPEGERLAREIAIKEVAVYQGVKVPIVRNMAAITDRNADLVQQREALLRVFVEPGGNFQSRALTARVTLQDGTEEPRRFETTLTVERASSDPDTASTFNIDLPKDAFKEGTQYAVELRETSKCTPLVGSAVGARFPETGLAALAARATGPVKVLLVPVRYQADGSGRLPDTSPEQLEQMKTRLYSMYPTSEVVISIREAVGTDRTDLGDMLDQVRQLRDTDDPPSDLSYYGMVRQADTFKDYCRGGCTTGIAGYGSQNGTTTAGMGIGFLNAAAGTFVHELGHIYRRPHAPCGGAAGADEDYPYEAAKLGSWGYDIKTRELFDPGKFVDFMSYCSPDWISDYNYQLLLERSIVVNQRAGLRVLAPSNGGGEWRTALVDAQGQARWGLSLHPRNLPPGDPVAALVLDVYGVGLTQVVAYHEEVPHGDSTFFVPAAQVGWHSVQLPGAAALRYAVQPANTPFSR